MPSAVRITLPAEPASYRPRTAAAMTGLSRPLISGAIKKGELQALRLGSAVIIPRESLEAWLNRAVPWGAR